MSADDVKPVDGRTRKSMDPACELLERKKKKKEKKKGSTLEVLSGTRKDVDGERGP